jgi:hypothetical protein
MSGCSKLKTDGTEVAIDVHVEKSWFGIPRLPVWLRAFIVSQP